MRIIRTVTMAIALLAAGQTFAQEALWEETRHTIFVNVGFGKITSEMDDISRYGLDDIKYGATEQLGYSYNFSRAAAIGGLLELFTASDNTHASNGIVLKDLALTYLAPQLVLGAPFSQQSRWGFELRVGAGMLFVHKSSEDSGWTKRDKESSTKIGWAVNAALGLEFRVSSLIGITASVSDTCGRSPKDTKSYSTEWEGINRFTVSIGTKFHF